MFVVDDVLLSNEVLDAPFACNLDACRGGCCVQGDSGAPLLHEECEKVELVVPYVKKYLRPEALEVIEKRGVWEEVAPGCFAVNCIDRAECVFVTYDGLVSKCAIQKAYNEDRIQFEKPISCHLFPVRVQQCGAFETLNYEKISLCDPARKKGNRMKIQLIYFLERPLVRKYGKTWFTKFKTVYDRRRELIGFESG